MSGADGPRLISCDESGFTGPDLLDPAQPIFAYAARDLPPSEAEALITALGATRKTRPLSDVELKAKTLRERPDWATIVAETLDAVESNALVIVMDKRLALGAKTFEYIIEPVIADNSALFYQSGIHRFVADEAHRALQDPALQAIAEGLSVYMKTFRIEDAPIVFEQAPTIPDGAKALREVLRFARGYRERIGAENAVLQTPSRYGKWVLDLTATALQILLADGFGKPHAKIDVLCDDSGPLCDMKEFFDAMAGRDETIPMLAGDHYVTWRLNLANPVTYGSSKAHKTLQVANIIAGAAADIYSGKAKGQLAALKPRFDAFLHTSSIMPGEAPDPNDPHGRFCMRILRELGARAELSRDPLTGMENVFRAAYRSTFSPAARAGWRARPS